MYASYLNLIKRSLPVVSVQSYDLEEQLSRAVPRFRITTEAYLDQRSLIPEGRLIEVPYKELDADPIATLRRIYQSLDLPSFDVAEPRVREYLDSLGEYQKNPFRQLDDDARALLAREWRRCFEAWGYDPARA